VFTHHSFCGLLHEGRYLVLTFESSKEYWCPKCLWQSAKILIENPSLMLIIAKLSYQAEIDEN
jgi:hypothetical protein